MNINKIEIRNFKNLQNLSLDFDKKISVFTGKNGAGKTSLMEAIAYGLTGEYPDDVIRHGSDEMSVKTYFPTFDCERIQKVGKPNKVKYNNKTSTAKIISEELTNLFNVSVDEIKAVTFTDLIKNSKNSAELESFIMNYLDDTLTLEDICNLFPSSYKDLDAKDIDEAKDILPEFISNIGPYSIDDIETIASDLKESRKYIKKKKQETEGAFVNIPEYVCNRSEAEIKKEYEAIIQKEAVQKEAQKNLAAYNNAKTSRERQENEIKRLQLLVNDIHVEKTPDVVLLSAKTACDNLQNQIMSFEKSKIRLENVLSTVKKSLENLNKPFCPLSDKITCTVDKTPVQKELTENISELEEGIKEETENINKLKKELEEKKAELEKYQLNDKEYEKKILYLKNIDSLKQTLITVPEKPENADIFDFSEQKNSLNSELDKIKKISEKNKLKFQIEQLDRNIKLLDFLIDELDAKGYVRESIMNQNLSWINDYIQKRLTSVFPNAKIEFVSDDGIKIKASFDQSKGMTYYEGLSGGEKVITLLFILDFINAATQTNILFMDGDDLSKLDEDSFFIVLDLLLNSDFSNNYDQIFINCINSERNMKLLKKYKGKILQIDL